MEKGQQRLVLVVEDEPELLNDITEDLKAYGFVTLSARNGQHALDLLKIHKTHAILSDINMPKKTGLDLLAELRSHGDETPFVILTAFHDKENILKALRIGVNDFLEKPFHFDTLCAVMTKAVQLGIELRKIDEELEELCKKSNIPNEIKIYFKRARMAPLIMRRDLEIHTKTLTEGDKE